MKSLSGIGLGLSVIFGCLVLALVGELYYLLWWKKRITNRRIEERYSSSPAKELLYMFCLKKPSSIIDQSALNPEEICSSGLDGHVLVQVQSSSSSSSRNDHTMEANLADSEETMDAELMRLHKISGPPKFLFTIVEETKEDLLEFEDGRSGKGSKSLSELLVAIETPYLTPIASPSMFTPPLTPSDGSYKQHGFNFNPMFESSTDTEFVRMMVPSPPPKFKFLQDAEEKLRRKRMVVDAEKNAVATMN